MMITINLKPGLKRKRGGNAFGGVKERLADITARVKDPLLIAAVVAWVAVLGGLGVMYAKNAAALADSGQRLEQARAEHKRFKTFIAQKRKQELIRDSLLAQIGVIRGVDRDRYVWSHVLDEVAQALPAYTWLVDIGTTVPAAAPVSAPVPAGAKDTSAADSARPPLAISITGRTVDIQAYTKFLRQLEASPWIENVQPQSVTTVIEHDRPVTAFVVSANYTTADSAYIRTVPLSQSVR